MLIFLINILYYKRNIVDFCRVFRGIAGRRREETNWFFYLPMPFQLNLNMVKRELEDQIFGNDRQHQNWETQGISMWTETWKLMMLRNYEQTIISAGITAILIFLKIVDREFFMITGNLQTENYKLLFWIVVLWQNKWKGRNTGQLGASVHPVFISYWVLGYVKSFLWKL